MGWLSKVSNGITKPQFPTSLASLPWHSARIYFLTIQYQYESYSKSILPFSNSYQNMVLPGLYIWSKKLTKHSQITHTCFLCGILVHTELRKFLKQLWSLWLSMRVIDLLLLPSTFCCCALLLLLLWVVSIFAGAAAACATSAQN